jgi:pyrimidine-nucleoside phosphorylase
MVKIGVNAGKKMDYTVGDMNEPLGYNIGNRLEAYEAIELLSGKTGKLRNETLNLAAKCISLGLNVGKDKALKMATDAIDNGSALKKLKEMVKAQGGNVNLFKGLGIKPTLTIKSNTSGILKKINCSELGFLVGSMGATRQKITDTIDYNVGIKTFHKLGDEINIGDTLFEIYAKNKTQANEFAQKFVDCYKIV